MGEAAFPPYAYVPGVNQRHPEGAFDPIRDTAQPEMDQEQLAKCDAFVFGLRYLETGYFWEAHEVLEPVWMALRPNSVARSVVQGLIQLANARLKLKMMKPNAAGRLFRISLNHLEVAKGAEVMGVGTRNLSARIEAEFSEIGAI